MEGDYILIKDMNGVTQVEDKFDDYYTNGVYIVIDEEALAETIANEILEEKKEKITLDDITKEVTERVNEGVKMELIEYVVYALRHYVEE